MFRKHRRERLAGLALEQRLAGLTLEQIFEKFDSEKIEAYLKKRRKKALSC
ncbi:MAG: hypothetical protein GY795_48160 [Desulfobacterales bacterium]|nr:hypothetical protein [Desulfobacterales bacterium]